MSGRTDRLAALADEWERDDDLTQWGSHHKSRCARQLRALLAEDETPATPDDVETLADLLDAHRPVIGRFANLNGVVGCSCMDRVFVARRENYSEHVAAVLADRLAAARREGADAALAPVEALREEWGWIKSDDPTPTRLDMYLNLGTAIVQGWDATGGAL